MKYAETHPYFVTYWRIILAITLILPACSQETSEEFIAGPMSLLTYTSASVQFSSVQSLSRVQLFMTPWITARQASLSITNCQISLRLMSIESVIPSSHLILCRPLLLLPLISPIIRVFSNESTLPMRWPKYWSFSFSIMPPKEIPGLISLRMDWLGLLVIQRTLKTCQLKKKKWNIY